MVRLCIPEQERDWPKVCAALELLELMEDPRFAELEARLENMPALIKILDVRFTEEDREHWLEKLAEHDVPHSGVSTYDDVAKDAQMEAIGVFAEFEHPTAGTVRTVTNPWTLKGRTRGSEFPRRTWASIPSKCWRIWDTGKTKSMGCSTVERPFKTNEIMHGATNTADLAENLGAKKSL